MNEADLTNIAEAPAHLEPDTDSNAQIDNLRAAGADTFDPVRFRYIEALAKRAAAYQGSARQLIDAKLADALISFKERFDLAYSDAKEAVGQSVERRPDQAKELQRLLAAGEFKALRRLISGLKTKEQADEHRASLSALVRELDDHASDNTDTPVGQHAAPLSASPAAPFAELKAIRNFRDTWSKLSVGRQVAQALEQAPKNAGPINSHMLVLRTLAMMQEISPDYLNRFMSYADTLLALDQDEKEKLLIKEKQGKQEKQAEPQKPGQKRRVTSAKKK